MTKSLEDYLEAIHVSIMETGSAHVADIARALGVKMPSVNNAVKVLAKLGLADYEKYQSIKLTPAGEKAAGDIFLRHELLRKFLVALGVSRETAETEACAMEHILSMETLSCIREFVDKYTQCGAAGVVIAGADMRANGKKEF